MTIGGAGGSDVVLVYLDVGDLVNMSGAVVAIQTRSRDYSAIVERRKHEHYHAGGRREDVPFADDGTTAEVLMRSKQANLYQSLVRKIFDGCVRALDYSRSEAASVYAS